MDFPDNDEQLYQPDQQGFAQPQPPCPPPQPSGIKTPAFTQKTQKTSGWRIFCRIMFMVSIIANIFLFLAFIGFAAMFAVSEGSAEFIEKTIVSGSSNNKIAIVRLEGIIDNTLCHEVTNQIEMATRDKNVKALIIRTITPGGGVAASDRIHHQITKFRKQTGKPVIAFMQTVAASGGYYTSVACDKIIAEPTTITGSIGVMLNHITIKVLLEEKLGVTPVVIKSGEKKDWPSMFSETTEEQKQYLADKLIAPAYERFVDLVVQGRKDALSPLDVKALADGSIYGASEALENKLIDQIGYLDEAIALAKSMADIENPRVVEYRKPFSFSSILMSQKNSVWNIDRTALQELAVPQLMYLWDANW